MVGEWVELCGQLINLALVLHVERQGDHGVLFTAQSGVTVAVIVDDAAAIDRLLAQLGALHGET